MMNKLRRKASYANVMSTLAFVIALSGGTAYAAHELIDSSDVVDESLIGTDIRGIHGNSTAKGVNGSLTGADISGQPPIAGSGQAYVNGSLNTWDLADSGILGRDVRNDSLTGADIDESSLVLKVPGYELVVSDPFKIPAGTQTEGAVYCPLGKLPVGGGPSTWTPSLDTHLNSSGPAVGGDGRRGWHVIMNNTGSSERTFSVTVVCVAG